MFGKIIGLLLAVTLGFFCHREIVQNDSWLQLGSIIVVFGIVLWTVPLVLYNHRHITRFYGIAFTVGFLAWWGIGMVRGS